jgi:endonuclease YncB( thermonuclease family)
MPLLAALALSCIVVDGDTLRCATEGGRSERIRVSGIDAPETSACRPGRHCVDGDGQASRRALELLVEGAELRLVRLGRDRYGRTIAAIYADGINVACQMLARGHAIYRRDWDNRGLVERDCHL